MVSGVYFYLLKSRARNDDTADNALHVANSNPGSRKPRPIKTK